MLYLNKNLFLKTGLLTILWSITNIDNIFPVDGFYKNQEELRALRNKGNAYTFSRLGPVRAARSLAEYMKPAATKAIQTAHPYIDQGKKAASKQFTKFTDTARPYINQVKKTTSPYLTRLQAPSIPQNIPHLTDTRTQQSAPSSWWESLKKSIGSGLSNAKSYFSSSAPTISPTVLPVVQQQSMDTTDSIYDQVLPTIEPQDANLFEDPSGVDQPTIPSLVSIDTPLALPEDPLIDSSYYKKGRLAAGILGATLAAGAIARKAKRLPIETEIKFYEILGKILNRSSETSIAAATKLGKTANKMSHYWKEGKIPLSTNVTEKLAKYLSYLNDYDRGVWYNRLKPRLFDQDLGDLISKTNSNISSRVYLVEPKRFDCSEIDLQFPTIEYIPKPALEKYTVPRALKPVTVNPDPSLILPGSKPVKAPEIILPKSQLTTPSANPDLAIPMIDKPLISRKPAIHLGHSIKQITPGNTIPGARFGNKIANIRPPEYPRPGDSLLTTSIPKPAPKKVIKLGSGDISGPTIHLGDGKPPLTRGQKAALTRAKNKAA